MNAEATLRFLNRLKDRKIIRDFVLVGGVAAIFYTAPRETKDVDAVVLVDDTWREYAALWSRIRDEAGGASGEAGHEHMIYVTEADTWLDIMATGRDKFYTEVLQRARIGEAGEQRAKVSRPEHLIIMSLRAWRPDPDYSRIAALYPKSNKRMLQRLLKEYDDAGQTLTKRLAAILELRGLGKG